MFIDYDITFCDNQHCPERNKCYRNIAYIELQKLIKQNKIDNHYVSVTKGKDDGECDLFWRTRRL